MAKGAKKSPKKGAILIKTDQRGGTDSTMRRSSRAEIIFYFYGYDILWNSERKTSKVSYFYDKGRRIDTSSEKDFFMCSL